MKVPGDTAEERSNAQLETAKNVIMQDKELSKGGQMTLMLLCSLIGEGRPICPKNFDPRLPLQRLCHLKVSILRVCPSKLSFKHHIVVLKLIEGFRSIPMLQGN